MASSEFQDPLAWAIAIASRPASVMRPAASSRATRSLLLRAQVPLGRRGANHSFVLSSSTRFTTPSIQPKQSASSTASSYATVGLVVCFFRVTSHTPDEVRWFAASQARHSSRVAGWIWFFSSTSATFRQLPKVNA